MTTDIPPTLSLAHNGGEWQGTFQYVLRTLFENLLTQDETPIDVRLTLLNDRDEAYTRDVTVTGVDDRFLVLDGGERIDRHNEILAVSVL